MLYNHEETIYHKDAARLWIFTAKLLSKVSGVIILCVPTIEVLYNYSVI